MKAHIKTLDYICLLIITLEQIFIRNVRHSLINRWTGRIAINGQMTEGDHKSGKALRPLARCTNVPTVPTLLSTFTYLKDIS